MVNKNLFEHVAEMLKEPVEYIVNKKILKKYIQEFNMSNGDRFRVTISKLATLSKPKTK